MLDDEAQRSTAALAEHHDHDAAPSAVASSSRSLNGQDDLERGRADLGGHEVDDGDDLDDDDEKTTARSAARRSTPSSKRAMGSVWPLTLIKTSRDRTMAKLVVLAAAIALAVGLGVGLTRNRHKNNSGSSSANSGDGNGSTSTTGSSNGITAVDTSVIGKSCNNSDLINLARDPQFWAVSIQSPDLVIRPKDWKSYSNCEQLNSAWFTVRLLFPDQSIRLLEDPNQLAAGMYHYNLVPPVGKAADGTVTVEAVLELDEYPANGMPCNAAACNYTSLLDEGYKWVGGTILDDSGQMPQYDNELATLPTVTTTTAICPRLDYLPGSFNNETGNFTPIGPDGKPCRLLTVDESVATPTGTPLRWWRFLGDSNMRFFFVWNYPKSLGATQCVKSGRKLHVLCWDNTTAWTWDWWFGEEDVGATADRLQTWLGETLNDYIYERNDDPWDLRWHNDPNLPSTLPTQFVNFTQPAERIYVSMGSHASQLTNEGWTEIMDRITPIMRPFKDALVIVLTSATAPSRIPIKYIKDTVMRHNVQINMSNQVVMEYAKQLGVRVLDIFTLTRTTGPRNMIDNVHFPNTVYKIWTRLFFTERFGPGWIP
ncbi:hypothetical protein OIO90_006316 [Microbotryomycetes sp. JL221]|nr:hypothetical protein OIO90_006316 [Microbotryomycetes sp. JL221]